MNPDANALFYSHQYILSDKEGKPVNIFIGQKIFFDKDKQRWYAVVSFFAPGSVVMGQPVLDNFNVNEFVNAISYPLTEPCAQFVAYNTIDGRTYLQYDTMAFLEQKFASSMAKLNEFEKEALLKLENELKKNYYKEQER